MRKSSSAVSAKKQRKTIEWERLEISSRKLEIPRKIRDTKKNHAKMGIIKNRNGMDLRSRRY